MAMSRTMFFITLVALTSLAAANFLAKKDAPMEAREAGVMGKIQEAMKPVKEAFEKATKGGFDATNLKEVFKRQDDFSAQARQGLEGKYTSLRPEVGDQISVEGKEACITAVDEKKSQVHVTWKESGLDQRLDFVKDGNTAQVWKAKQFNREVTLVGKKHADCSEETSGSLLQMADATDAAKEGPFSKKKGEEAEASNAEAEEEEDDKADQTEDDNDFSGYRGEEERKKRYKKGQTEAEYHPAVGDMIRVNGQPAHVMCILGVEEDHDDKAHDVMVKWEDGLEQTLNVVVDKGTWYASDLDDDIVLVGKAHSRCADPNFGVVAPESALELAMDASKILEADPEELEEALKDSGNEDWVAKKTAMLQEATKKMQEISLIQMKDDVEEKQEDSQQLASSRKQAQYLWKNLKQLPKAAGVVFQDELKSLKEVSGVPTTKAEMMAMQPVADAKDLVGQAKAESKELINYAKETKTQVVKDAKELKSAKVGVMQLAENVQLPGIMGSDKRKVEIEMPDVE